MRQWGHCKSNGLYFFYGRVSENHQLGTGFFVYHRTVSAVKRVEFVSDSVSYIVLRGRWCNIRIVLNVHAPSEEKSDDSKESFHEELEQVFDHFPKYHRKILLRDFNAKLGSEDIFKPASGNDRLHQDSNDNGVRIVNFVTSKNLAVNSSCMPPLPHLTTSTSTKLPYTLLLTKVTLTYAGSLHSMYSIPCPFSIVPAPKH